MADPHHLIGGAGDEADGEHSGVVSDGGPQSDELVDPTRNPAGTPDPAENGDEDDEVDPLERIEKLHSLREAGAITEAEYQTKKSELLDQV